MAADTNVGMDKFNITNMDKDVMARLGVTSADALNVAVHYVMIATVVDEADTCIGYRLYDCRYNNVYNYTRASVIEQLAKGTVPIANLTLIDNESQDVISEKDVPAEGTYTLLCTQGDFKDYPKVLQSGELAKGSAETYTYIATADGMMYFVDYRGKVATYPLATERLLSREAREALGGVLGSYAKAATDSLVGTITENNLITSYLNFPPFKISNLAWIPDAYEHNPWSELGTAGAIFKMLYAWVAEASPRSLLPVLGVGCFYEEEKEIYISYGKPAVKSKGYDYASNMTLSSNMFAMSLNMVSMQDVYEKLCTNLSLYGVMRLSKQASAFIRTTCAFYWYQGIFAVKTAIRTVYKGAKVWTTVAMPISNGPVQNIEGNAEALIETIVEDNTRSRYIYSSNLESMTKSLCDWLRQTFLTQPISYKNDELLWNDEVIAKFTLNKYKIANPECLKPLLKKIIQDIYARENEICSLTDALSLRFFKGGVKYRAHREPRVTAPGYKEPKVMFTYARDETPYSCARTVLAFTNLKHALFLEHEPEHFYQAYSYYYELNLDKVNLDDKDPAQFWVKKCLTTPVGKTIRNQDKMIQRAIGVKRMTLLNLYDDALIIRDKEENEEVPSVMEHINAGVVHKRGYMQETWYSALYPWLKDTTGQQLEGEQARTNLVPLICTMGLRGNERELAVQTLMADKNANERCKCSSKAEDGYLFVSRTYIIAPNDTVTFCDNPLSSNLITVNCTNIQAGEHRIVIDCSKPIMYNVCIEGGNDSGAELIIQLYSTTETLYLPEIDCILPYTLQITGANTHYIVGSSVVRDASKYGPTRVLISAPVTYITPYAFANYEQLLSISLPATLKTVPVGLCYSCKNLREVTFATTQQQIDTPEGKQTIEAGAEVILQGAFYGAYKLEQLELPCTTKQILGEAFRHCMSLNDFTAVGLTQVANTAFMDTNNYMRAQVAGKVPIETTAQISAKMAANLRGTEKMFKQQKAAAKGTASKRTTSRKK